MKKSLLIIFLVLLVDQAVKIWVKTTMFLGEEIPVAGEWFRISFVENYGMAFGMEFGGEWGKLLLSIFRIIVVSWMTAYLLRIARKPDTHRGILVAFSLIVAGAIGNIIDSAFYGLIFDKGTVFDPATGFFHRYSGIAQFSTDGYAPVLHGCVVDMFYFPVIRSTFPEWLPIWGGEDFVFFSPVFNIADAAITCGVAVFLIYRKHFFKEEEKEIDNGQLTMNN